jgi:hypothetical protein
MVTCSKRPFADFLTNEVLEHDLLSFALVVASVTAS